MIIDILYAIVIVLAILKGLRKGLIIAAFSIVAYIVGLAAALKLSAVVADHLKDSVNVSAKWLPFLSFALVFLVVVLLVYWVGKIIERSFEAVMLGWANRIAGAVLYIALYSIIFSIFLFYAEKIKLLNPSTISASVTYSFIQPWGPIVIDGFGKLIPVFRDMFDELSSFFEKLQGDLK